MYCWVCCCGGGGLIVPSCTTFQHLAVKTIGSASYIYILKALFLGITGTRNVPY
jgi:hypothetical protein